MTGPAVQVDALVKHFRVHRRAGGLRASLRGVGRRQWSTTRAVDGVSFEVGGGEVVGFLGPNGAGKTTTLKCLAGLLHPTSGAVRVLDAVPHERRREFLSSITLVMGQRTSLFWDLPAMDTFLVNRAIYRLGEAEFRTALDELVALLRLEDLLTQQVRSLSLGERMRCELASPLLHRPRVLFLDEPTLGLDVEGQVAVRRFVADYSARAGATVLLTSHYMGDVTALTSRVLVIDDGRLRYDGDLPALVERVAPHRLVKLTLATRVARTDLERYGRVERLDGAVATLAVPRADTTAVAARLLADLPVLDVAIEEPPIEDVVAQVFAGG